MNNYNVGNIVYSEGYTKINSIAGDVSGEAQIINSYYLENTINGKNDNIIMDGVIVKTSQELKEIYIDLGTSWKKDTNNINNGYPILQWQ